MKLVILESPNKREKVGHYLGPDYKVLATAGHFRDLPDKGLGVDVGSMTPEYVVDPDKKKLLAQIRDEAKKADEVILATDADREGEAISWHLAQELHLQKPMRLKAIEITEKALQQAVRNLVPLDQNLVDAQQARRVLDRLVGYQVSPLLSDRFGRGQSAGRVQSATLHLVVAREIERETFRSENYWVLSATYAEGFTARYAAVTDKGKLEDVRFKTEAEAQSVAERARAGVHQVSGVDITPAESKPKPPFTTSSLQQAASKRLKLKPDRTMALAQELFEKGLISYHRTDSVALSDDAIELARAFIGQDYPKALPEAPVRYKVKGDAQGAHEAIRPTSLDPKATEGLSAETAALYDLIRRQFIACQCAPAQLERTTISVQASDTTWRARGTVVLFDSWRHYTQDEPDAGDAAPDSDEEEGDAGTLPKVTEGQRLDLKKVDCAGKKTSPPGRYTEASLVAAMEKSGIGRPSTYANTVKTLFDREYIAEEKRQVYPTPAGRRIDAALGASFPELLECKTTAELEQRLDEVADGTRHWKDELRGWYGPFHQRLEAAGAILDEEVKKYPELVKAAPQASGKPCPRCGRDLQLRPRKDGDGQFLACPGFKPTDGQPACNFVVDAGAEPFDQPCPKCGGPTWKLTGKSGVPYARCVAKADCDGKIDLAAPATELCPKCGAAMVDRGTFLGCTKYPACKGTLDKKALKVGKKCPDCGKLMQLRHGAKGDFWGCSGYPECKKTEPADTKGATKPSGKAGGGKGKRA